MKKIILLFTMLLFSVTASAKLKVVTTLPDFAALAQEVGGDLIEVTTLARGDQDPHYLEPKPSYALTLNKADLLIDAGLELEVGWLPVLLTQCRNPKIQSGQPGHLTASSGFRILEIPEGRIDRSAGDVHPDGNPHYWLNPNHGLIIAKNIAARLSDLDPANASRYEQNFAAFSTRLKAKISAWEKDLAAFKGKKIVTYHKSFSYFVDWSGLEVVDLIEPKPGIPPSPAHILGLIEKIKAEKIPLIITENYYDPKPSRELSQKTGAKLLLLPTSVGGEAAIKTYDDLFETLVKKILGALFFAYFRNDKIPQEAIIGVSFAVSSAVAILLADFIPHGAEHLKYILAGNILWVNWFQIIKTAVIYAILGLIHYRLRHRLLLVSSNPREAERRGMRVWLWDLFFYLTFGLVITSSVQIGGILLVFSFLIVPALCSMLFFEDLRKRIALGWLIGALTSLIGLYASYHWNLPTGPAIVTGFGLALAISLFGKACVSRK
ncbi:MAG: zinc ABC transporter substrate-binding protein [Deltaproteobacteria bacterium]|nr:zinc ABC transporter substrate-binding protein [Deltaproteobacteria bacterium]